MLDDSEDRNEALRPQGTAGVCLLSPGSGVGGVGPEDAEQAWNDVDELRREWAASVSPFARLRYALSLKSLRWRRRARRQADAARKGGRSLVKRMGRRKGKR